MNKTRPQIGKIASVLVVFRKDTPNAQQLAVELSSWLKKKKIKVFSHPQQVLHKSVQKAAANKIKKVDLVIVLGGDGTYLEAVRLLDGLKTPILGVNLGSLGFLTEIRVENLYEVVEMALAGQMEMRPRSMLTARVKSKNKSIKEFTALNDIVIERGPYSHLINLAISSERLAVCDVKADGVIIASPTGSTAYNLAAGGPILHPQVRAIVVTPICPHSLTNRPIIFPDDLKLSFRLKTGKKQKAVLTVDGVNRGELTTDDEIVIKKAKCFHYVLRMPSHNYFQLLREKLKFGERA